MVAVSGLGKRFGHLAALDGVSIEVCGGEVVGLLGPNGAGKTTLIRVLSTLVIPDEGTASIAGEDVVHAARRARANLGLVVGDERSWYWRLSAIENLSFFASLSGMPRRRGRRRGAELLEQFGIADQHHNRVGRFSAGMRARLGLCRALLADPPVLILDEATRSIDPVGSLEFRDHVRALAVDAGKAILMATHDLHEAAAACDRVVVLDRGAVVERLAGPTAADLEVCLREVSQR
jgi:ABC-2 type transport system ATP-binding protein